MQIRMKAILFAGASIFMDPAYLFAQGSALQQENAQQYGGVTAPGPEKFQGLTASPRGKGLGGLVDPSTGRKLDKGPTANLGPDERSESAMVTPRMPSGTFLDVSSCLSPVVFRRVEKPSGRDLPCQPKDTLERLVMWNHIALDTTSIDHTPAPVGPRSSDGVSSFQQIGPHRSSRAMAIVHIAMFDALNKIVKRHPAADKTVPFYESYSKVAGFDDMRDDRSLDVAIAFAAHRTLVYLYPQQKGQLDRFLLLDTCASIGLKRACDEASSNSAPSSDTFAGLSANDLQQKELGEAAAREIIDARSSDNSQHLEPKVGDPGFERDTRPGMWQPDPVSGITAALGGLWGKVTPFTRGTSGNQFRPPPPPALTDPIYTRDFNEVKRLGGDAQYTRTDRSDTQTFTGVFWAYDGTAFLCAPPRLYNQVVRTLVLDKDVRDAIMAAQKEPAATKTSTGETPSKPEPNKDEIRRLNRRVLDVARVLALTNTAMADAAISAWEAKYTYRFWRPVTGIRAGSTDLNPDTPPDMQWRPLAAPASNAARGKNFTPPFPAYPSGHAVFGGAVFEVLRRFFPENTPFTFVSDEYNGYNSPAGADESRPLLPQSFPSLTAAEQDNARSRIYLGVHWQFDADAGVAQGNQVGNNVWSNHFRCLDAKGATTECDRSDGNAPKDEDLAKRSGLGVAAPG